MAARWSDEEILLLKEKYGKSTCKELKRLFGRSPIGIHIKARKLGLSSNLNKRGQFQQKYVHNEHFFKIPNILNSYWAGFIAADGCLNDSGGASSLQISLNKKDAIHLEQFRCDINSTGLVKITEYKWKVAKLRIGCASQLFLDLGQNFNITPRKTHTLLPPSLVDFNHKLAYIIGYIDGDGSIMKTKCGRNYDWISIVGTRNLLLWISSVFNELEPSKSGKTNVYKGKSMWMYSLQGPRATKILDRLRQIPTPKLERKWKR